MKYNKHFLETISYVEFVYEVLGTIYVNKTCYKKCNINKIYTECNIP